MTYLKRTPKTRSTTEMERKTQAFVSISYLRQPATIEPPRPWLAGPKQRQFRQRALSFRWQKHHITLTFLPSVGHNIFTLAAFHWLQKVEGSIRLAPIHAGDAHIIHVIHVRVAVVLRHHQEHHLDVHFLVRDKACHLIPMAKYEASKPGQVIMGVSDVSTLGWVRDTAIGSRWDRRCHYRRAWRRERSC